MQSTNDSNVLPEQAEDLRQRIESGFLYTVSVPQGGERFIGPISTRKYYDEQLALGDTPMDILSTILQHRDEGLICLTRLTQTK